MLLSIYTFIHVAISLIGIGSGVVVMFGLVTGRSFSGWTSLYLVTTVLTSVTGFGFPVARFMPSHAVGILSLIVLTFAVLALYRFHLEGAWRWVYVITAVLAMYFNVFVLVVQSFQKITLLKAMAPAQSEPPFVFTQAVVLGVFTLIAIRALISFPGDALRATVARRQISEANAIGR